MTALCNTNPYINIDSINTNVLFTQLHSALSESTTHRKDEIISFINNNPLGRVLIIGSAGVGKSYLLERVVNSLNEMGTNISRVYSCFNYNETIHEDFARNKTLIIDGLDEFLSKDRADVQHLILLGGPCIVTMRSTVVRGQTDAEYQNLANRFDLIINLDDDFGKHKYIISGTGGTGKSSQIQKLLRDLTSSIQNIISDKISLILLENTIQGYDQLGNIKIIEPGIILPSKEIVYPSKEIITEVSIIKESIIDEIYKNPELVYNMSPRQFEELIAELYDKLGYKVELTKTTRDGGKDIIIYSDGPTGHNMYYVECKMYKKDNKIDVELVRSFYGVVEASRATAGILVTSSSFTKDAKEFEKQVYRRLTLLDYMDLLSAVMNKKG